MAGFIGHDATDQPLRVGIVGGGPGGLFTAWHLERLASTPLEVTIFEAACRLGGKVLTPAFTAAPVRYEAGAAELYDYSPVDHDPLRELVRSLGLPTVPLAGGAVNVGGRPIANLDDVAAAFGPAGRRGLVAFDEWARSALSPREFYESGSGSSPADGPPERFDDTLAAACPPAVGPYVETLIHSDLATEPARTTRSYGLQNYLMNDPAYMRLYRIAGGNEGLVSALAARLAARVRLDAPVEQVCGEPHGPVRIRWRERGTLREEAFDVVILALPVEPLSRLAFADDALEAAMHRHVAHHDHPAHYLRVTLLIEGPTPRIPTDDDFLMLDAFGGSCLYVETNREPAAGHGVLGLLVAGAAAAELADRSDEALVAMTMAALPPGLVPAGRRVIEARVHRWVGAVSAAPGGWIPLSPDRRHQPSAEHPNLFVVGDYLYDSTLNGVLDSAEYVAGWVAARHEPHGNRPPR